MIPYIHIPDLDLKIVTLHPFGILVAIGVLVGTGLTTRRAKRLGYDLVQLNSFITWMLVVGFIGGHVLDSIMYHWDELVRRPWSIFALWEGLSSFGGFIGAFTGIVLWKYFEWRPPMIRLRAKPAPILPYADLVLSVFPIGWIFGRSGCSVVHDHPGAQAPSPNWLTVEYPLPGREGDAPHTKVGFIDFIHGSVPTYDMGLLELMFTIIVAACFVATWRRKLATGTYVVVTCLAYAPVRFAMDYLRQPEPRGDPRYDLLDMLLKAVHLRAKDAPMPEHGLALTPAQWLCMLMFAFGIAMLVKVLKMRARGFDPADQVRVAAPTSTPGEAQPHEA